MYIVYILACADASFHTGITKKLDERLAYHSNGENSESATYSRLPIKLVFQQSFDCIKIAIAFHKELVLKSAVEITKIITGKETLIIPNQQEEKRPTTPLKSIVLPTTYLGNLAYYSIVSQQDELIIDVNELFQKQTYRSRCTILSANGTQNLVVPVIRPKGKNTPLKEVLISYAENWQKDHVKAIGSAYRRAPYFEFYGEKLFEIIEKKHTLLIELNLALTHFFIEVFNWNCTVKYATNLEQSQVDMKIMVSPKSRLNHKGKAYHQIFNEGENFEENLSLIDLLFNGGVSTALNT